MGHRQKNLEPLSKFEWTIMNRIWEKGRQTAREVMEALPVEHRRAYTTIQTYLERLVEKGYLQKEKLGLVNFYTATVNRSSVVEGATSHFVNQVFGGSASRLAAFLLPNINLQPEDILVIRQMLKEAEDQNG
ncbi:MAG: hypothetical protein COY19_11925 [Candidatus Marinimicrobia bacterium CG_4_10_14_0_2_um_filter_48_9]|nr:MAG: hypothetical protein COY19_11925 [Candidatus Marinimicrobia bacterium CG_4_10_14_0_2_um_filter_48_9]